MYQLVHSRNDEIDFTISSKLGTELENRKAAYFSAMLPVGSLTYTRNFEMAFILLIELEIIEETLDALLQPNNVDATEHTEQVICYLQQKLTNIYEQLAYFNAENLAGHEASNLLMGIGKLQSVLDNLEFSSYKDRIVRLTLAPTEGHAITAFNAIADKLFEELGSLITYNTYWNSSELNGKAKELQASLFSFSKVISLCYCNSCDSYMALRKEIAPPQEAPANTAGGSSLYTLPTNQPETTAVTNTATSVMGVS